MTKGILPVAGHATRIQGLPKYLLPVPGGYLLERMLSRMDVPCFIGGNPDNAALLERYKRPQDQVYQVASATMCETILTARPLVGDHNVLMGMPDTYWTDDSVFQSLTGYLNVGAMCVLAVWLVGPIMASRLGVCVPKDRYTALSLERIENKLPQHLPQLVWGAMAWTSEFWQYMQPEDVHPGVAVMRAVAQGIDIPLYLASGKYYDNGIPDSYFRCIRELTGAAQPTAG